MQLAVLDESLQFPDIEKAQQEPDGLLAIGGDLSPERLLNAYYHGIFPWFSEGEPILWWSPGTRAVIHPTRVHISKSMKKWRRKCGYRVTLNNAFGEVIRNCAQRQNGDGTWITDEMIAAYQQLHQLGRAHSIEVWDDGLLVGGLYGVSVGQLFCGESMFHRQTNASKLAFIHLNEHFAKHGGRLIDAQMPTEHLLSMGVIPCTRANFRGALELLRDEEVSTECWQAQQL